VIRERVIMHMADALLSPAVGGAFWAATAGGVAYCSKKIRQGMDDKKVPLMGVLGAFIFAAQMINFTIPGTGSSGHLGGGLILAILLGPCPAFLVMASVLTVQALFFADGGLLALGANIFNLGVFPCFVAYPLVFRPLAGRRPSGGRLVLASVLAAVVALEFGAAGVVFETVASGISELPFSSFLALMLAIHLAIGVVEGVVTAAVVSFVAKAQPEMLCDAPSGEVVSRRRPRRVLVSFAVAAVLVGGILSWFASTRPDGLEWAIARITGSGEVQGRPGPVHGAFDDLQKRVALLPEYGFPSHGATAKASGGGRADAGASLSGLLGGVLTLLVAGAAGLLLRRRSGPA
jgi:cobalt/nickel transport system permease protein